MSSELTASTAFPLTFGVFQEFFSRDFKLSNVKHSIWIGVLSTGVPFLGAPFMTLLCDRYHKIKWRYYVVFGWLLCTASLVGAAFSKTLVGLAWAQGIIYGAGLFIMDVPVPVLLILNTWFVRRRGTAYGLLFGAADAIGFGFTVLADWLLRDFSLRGALLTFACILLVLSGTAILLLKFRPTDISAAVEGLDEASASPTAVRYYRRPIMYVFVLTNLFQSLAYYLPFLYLPSYLTSLGYTPTRGAYLLAAANFAQIFGEIGFGQLSDRFNVYCLILTSNLASAIAA
jgi:MFS family permease